MTEQYLHNHPEFQNLIRIVGEKEGILDVLVEKDYWIMHCLYSLSNMSLEYQLKGGTSLSKGFKLIHRFSEDIDIRIEPPKKMNVYIGKNQDKPKHRESRKQYYEWLAQNITIAGITDIVRDTEFDDNLHYRSGGIRVRYPVGKKHAEDLKSGVLLEVGFDDIVPNFPITISSWAFDYARDLVPIHDNRALNVPCYHPGYTLVEKLQTISTKFRKQQEERKFVKNFMRHYYDVYCLLGEDFILKFISTREYSEHKKRRFPQSDNACIKENQAFLMKDTEVFRKYKEQYEFSKSLYYKEKPSFEEILSRIKKYSEIL
jgi:nucleotidyltransferase AbiEii toxin of type IV toxin-antitoxin system